MNNYPTLILELRSLLDRYSDEEVGRAVREVLNAAPERGDANLHKVPSVRSSKSNSSDRKGGSDQKMNVPSTPRFVSNLPNRDLRGMNISELRRIADLVGVYAGPKDSKARLIARLKKSPTVDKGTNEMVSRPQFGEYEGWVNMIVKSRKKRRS